MYCSNCKHNGKQSGEWAHSPCSRCQLREDSHGTFEYNEARIENASWDVNHDDEEPVSPEPADIQCPAPFSRLEENDPDDPCVPLSALVSALSLWISLSLPARRTIQMRMMNLPYSEIGRRLGCTRQAAEKLVAQALAKEPLLQNLLPAKAAREGTPLSATRTSAIAGCDSFDAKR
jgi:hypothetical protein